MTRPGTAPAKRDLRPTARRIALSAAALVFLGIAVGSTFSPHYTARAFDYVLSTPDALSEYRAIYTGLFIAHVLVLGWAAWRVDLLYLGDAAAILILGQVAGRVLSAFVDGMPTGNVVFIGAVELAGAVAIAATRPRRPPPDRPTAS